MFEVTFLVLATGERVTRVFYSEYQARLFKNKLEHSKKCILISYLYDGD